MKKFLSISVLTAFALIFGAVQMKAQNSLFQILIDNVVEIVPNQTVTVDATLFPLPIVGTLITWNATVEGPLADKIIVDQIIEYNGEVRLGITTENLTPAEQAEVDKNVLKLQAEIAGIPVPVKAEAKLVGYPF